MNIALAKDEAVQKHGFEGWSDFRNKTQEDGTYNSIKYELLEEAFELYVDEQTKIRLDFQKELKAQKALLVEARCFHDNSKRNYGEAYRKLISEHIARLKGCQMLFDMVQSNHTHLHKKIFTEHANTVIEMQITKLKDEYKTGTWKFGEHYDGDDLPF